MAQGQQRNPLRRFRLQEYLGILFTSLILVTGLSIAFTGYHMVVRTIISATDHWAKSVGNGLKRESTNTIYRPVRAIIAMLVQAELPQAGTLENRLAALPVLRAMLDSLPVVDAIFTGYGNGEFFLIRPLRAQAAHELYLAPENSVLMVENIASIKGRLISEYLFFDAELKLLQSRVQGMTGYDPRTRDWYQKAKQKEGISITNPYLFFGTEEIGTTFAQKSSEGDAVVGVNIDLSRISALLATERPTKSSEIALFRPDGTLVASSAGISIQDLTGNRLCELYDLSPVVRLGIQMYKEGRVEQNININCGERDWILFLEELSFSAEVQSVMLVAIPKDEVLADADAFVRRTLLITVGVLFFSILLTWLFARGVTRPLRRLAEKAQRIRDFNFEEEEEEERIGSRILELHALSQGMEHMQDNLKKFLAITSAISAERNFDLLLERVLRETLEVAAADGGMVALLDEKANCFKDGSACWTGGKNGEGALCLMMDFTQADTSLPHYQAIYSNASVSASIVRGDRRSEVDFLAPGFDDPAVTHVDIFCLPLHDRMGKILGVLTLFKAMKPGGSAFQPPQLAFIKALASTVAIALNNQHLLKTQHDLRDALIHILAGAIDSKSPYTGGHCQRVPVIFQMLAQAACDAEEGPLKEYTLDDDQWEEAKLAAWLHDCGKVITPEYVVDKATKLETFYDRIHEIRTRFEVLKRDAEITSLRAVLNGADAEDERRKLEEMLRALDDDFAFVAASNIGGEFMDEAALERLAAISKRTWKRTLDKRLGVSRDELARMKREPAESLPVMECLLMNRPEHIFERNEKDRIPPDSSWEFKMNTPHFLYNKGELYNLGIRRGTLSEEERYQINDHIVQTILMLGKLPLLEHLRNVPEIAGAHHETMDGKGYPRRITRDSMSWSARMMAIADIFEALTASDRPYKQSKTLSQALKIMDDLKACNHIDPDLYELFLKAGIPQQYAKQYLKPDQIDI